MQIEERPNLRAVHYLNSIKYKIFEIACFKNAENIDEKKLKVKDIQTWYNNLKSFCKSTIKANGSIYRTYSYSLNNNSNLCGRLFCGSSIQGISKSYRGLIMRGLATDIDMCNAHPVILKYICNLHNIDDCACLSYYIDHRDECLSKFKTREIGKKAFLVATNMDKNLKGNNVPDFLKFYDKEMKRIQKKLATMEEYKNIVETIPDDKKDSNYLGCIINRILCYYENKILKHAIDYIISKNIEPAVLMFDGLMVYGDYYNDNELLKGIQDYVEKQMPSLNMKWAYKEHDLSLSIPDDFDENNYVDSNESQFLDMAAEFEKNHALIEKRSIYISQSADKIITMSRQQLLTSYEYMTYGENDKGVPLPFLSRWMKCNNNIRKYSDIGIYPKPSLCPNDIFNMWTPFAMELFTDPFDPHLDGKDFIMNHFKILCNNETNVYEYFCDWISHLFQYPEQKSIVPCFISKQGTGKSKAIECICNMIGSNKVLETRQPSEDVWGTFNPLMANAFLVNLDELSKSDTIKSMGIIKGLITQPTITINNKGVNKYVIPSYHRFIISTNSEDPIPTSDDDRRFIIIRCSDEKIGDKEYFKKLHDYVNDIRVLRTLYNYFKYERGDMITFINKEMPKTEYHNNLKEANKDIVLMFLEDFARLNDPVVENKDNILELSGKDIYNRFVVWKNENNINYETNVVKFGMKISNLNIKGITKGRHTKQGWTKYYYINDLRDYFGVGCLIDIDNI